MQTGDQLGPFRLQVSREQLVRYAGASDDYNPIHYDDSFAKALGLPGVIVHGMLNMGLVAQYIMDALPATAFLERCQVRFRQMVQPGESLEIQGRIREVHLPRLDIEVSLGVSGAKPAVTGRMVVRLEEV